MSSADPSFGLIYNWFLGETSWKTGMDANLVKIGALQFPHIISKALFDAPGGEAAGDLYLVNSPAVGDWLGHENDFAYYVDSGYVFYTPKDGWPVTVDDESDRKYMFNGTDWVTEPYTSTDLTTLTDGSNADALHTHIPVEVINKIVVSVNAVDVFIYDTNKDIDGGAWRERCSHLSWYKETLNTATRGATRKFPAVALIIATASTVTIYDATDDAVPMWMVFNTEGDVTVGFTSYCLKGLVSITSVEMANGELTVGSSYINDRGGINIVNFIGDFYDHVASLAETLIGAEGVVNRNTLITNKLSTRYTEPIISYVVNDVATTVLPDAPIDLATGLPIPTIAVATDGGVSVITDGGDVWDITGAVISNLVITSDRLLIVIGDTVQYGDMPIIDEAYNVWRDGYYNDTIGGLPSIQASTISSMTATAIGQVVGLTLLKENPTTPAEGMVAYVTKDYNSGWMQGDIELCLSGENLVDKCVKATVVTGTATHAIVATGAELQAITATSDLTATVTTGGECEGWEYVGGIWLFRSSITSFVGVSETAGTLTIVNGTVFTLFKYTNGTGATTEQIELIYNTERKMFEANSQITLAGTSDAVLAIDYDDSTDLTHIMTSYGRSTFKDLMMTESEATSVGVPSSISAVFGSLAQGGSTGVDYYSPAENLRTELKRVDEQAAHFGCKPEAFKFVGDTTTTDFVLPYGWTPTEMVYEAGLLVLKGAADEYTLLDNGSLKGISFNVAPAAVNVVIFAVRK